MLLAIDTSTRYAGVCLRDSERVVCSLSWHSTQNHSRELLPAIESALQRTGGRQALTGIAVASGPGGFSALRVGLSVAKGLAMPLDLPVVAVGTLECEAWPYALTTLPVCPLLDVGRNEVATATYQKRDAWVQLSEARICAPEDLATLAEGTPSHFVVCGEGVATREERLQELFGDRVLVVSGGHAGRLWGLAELGWHKLEAGQTEDLGALQPFYLRRPTIGRPATPRMVSS